MEQRWCGEWQARRESGTHKGVGCHSRCRSTGVAVDEHVEAGLATSLNTADQQLSLVSEIRHPFAHLENEQE
jgi:hypothetical protein